MTQIALGQNLEEATKKLNQLFIFFDKSHTQIESICTELEAEIEDLNQLAEIETNLENLTTTLLDQDNADSSEVIAELDNLQQASSESEAKLESAILSVQDAKSTSTAKLTDSQTEFDETINELNEAFSEMKAQMSNQESTLRQAKQATEECFDDLAQDLS